MNRMRQAISFALVLAFLSVSMTAQAQRRPYRLTDRQVGELIRRVEVSTDRFQVSLDSALDRSRIDGTRSEDNINAFVQQFEQATDQLRTRFNNRRSVAADVEFVLQQAASINDFMLRTRLSRRAQDDWNLVRTDLDALARAYGVTWNWTRQGVPTGSVSQGGAYRQSDTEVDAIIRRIENGADRYRASVSRSLNRGRYDGTRAEDNINNFIRDFETATDQLRSRFNSRSSAASDVENVLRRGAAIDDFMRRNRLNRQAETEWAALRTDLNLLASAYSVAWNWDTPSTYPNQYPNPGSGPIIAGGRLTGTFRLDPSRSDDPRAVADRVTRNLPSGERQRAYDAVLARLEAPEMIAIERRGRIVNIASSRAPQTTFEADGVERQEQLPNGRTARVSTRLNGDQLIVRSTGFRENDFTVTFDPIEGGNRLRVTREIWSERLGQQPVVVQNFYNRTSDVADFNIHTGSGSFPTGTTAGGDLVVRDGETLIAVLDNDLSTRDRQVGDRFTMTVRSPSQYEGAVIEGRVASVERGGRVTGRSQMGFDLDTIRLRNGQTYRFAGIVEGARTVSGEVVRVDNEGAVRDDSQTNKTVQRTAIGTAVGAIIGAIAGGGKGAAIGAIVGAAGGAGSVYVQGRDDLELPRGTEVTIRASGPR